MAVSRDQYGIVHSRLSKALAPDLTDTDALLAAEEDWREDTGATGANETGRMKFDAYAESLFGLADMWAAPSEEAYLEFLNQTYRSITTPAGKTKPTRSPAPLTRGKSAAGISGASSAELPISTEGRSFISRAEIRPLVPALDAAAQQGQRGAYAYSPSNQLPLPPTRSMRAMPSGAEAAAEFDDEVAERARAAARKVAPTVRGRRAISLPSRSHLAAIWPSPHRCHPAISPPSPHHLAGHRGNLGTPYLVDPNRGCQEGEGEGGRATTHRSRGGPPPRPPRHQGARGAGLLGWWHLRDLAARWHLCGHLCCGVAASVPEAPRLDLDGQKPRCRNSGNSRHQPRAASRPLPASHSSQRRGRSRGEAKAGAVRPAAVRTLRGAVPLGG